MTLARFAAVIATALALLGPSAASAADNRLLPARGYLAALDTATLTIVAISIVLVVAIALREFGSRR